MTPEQRIRKLLTLKAERTIEHLADELSRQAARVAWVRETSGALREAQREMDECLAQSVGGTDEQGTGTEASEKAFERLFEAEQAKVDAIYAQLRAVADHDRWPRHLYWSL